MIYPSGHLDEINPYRLEKTLEIWEHIFRKEKTSLKEKAENCLNILAPDVKALSEEATIDNIMQVEGTIRKFQMFLQRIGSPLANEFLEYAKSTAELLSQNIIERGNSIKFDIPVNEIIDKWKCMENDLLRLLFITHVVRVECDTITAESILSEEPAEEHPIMDLFSTNIPTDDYYTMSHQQMLSIREMVGTATLMGIIQKQDTLVDYLSLVVSAIAEIEMHLDAAGDQIQQDANMLVALAQLVANNLASKDDAIRGICYGASMFICAFSEKLLRILYFHLIKDQKYVPMNKATFGELLDVNNEEIATVFGENHIKNLSFFLQNTIPLNIGQNIRNNLAHWAKIATSEMTPIFVAKMMWLFTDILNTVFWWCIKDDVKLEKSDDQT